jgi:CRP-like cAMP-binding protein
MAAGFDWLKPIDFLAGVDEAHRRRLLEGARRVKRPAGSVSEYPTRPFTGDLVESGLLRGYQVSLDGREATIAYAHPGEYVGSLPGLEPLPVVYLQAVEETVVLRLNSDVFQSLMAEDPQMEHAIAVHVASRLIRVVRVVTVRTLGSVSEKIAFDLLERASAEQLRSGSLIVAVTHEELADSIGASREAVTRILGDLRRRQLIRTSHGRVQVDDPSRLAKIVEGLVT